MNEIRYHVDIEKDVDFKIPTIFLAGPTVRGNQTHLKSWRFEAVDILKNKGFDGNVIIPEFENGNVGAPIFSENNETNEYFEFCKKISKWEYCGLRNATVIMFWIPRTKEMIGLTTNHEHGYWMALEREKMVYGRPDDAYRTTYLDIMWQEDCKQRGWPLQFAEIHNALDKTINAAIAMCNIPSDSLEE